MSYGDFIKQFCLKDKEHFWKHLQIRTCLKFPSPSFRSMSLTSAILLFSIEATVPFLIHKQRRGFFCTLTFTESTSIFAHSYTKPEIAAAIAFDQEGVLETLSLALAYAEIKCTSFVSLIVALRGYSSFIGMGTHTQAHMQNTCACTHIHIYITKRDNEYIMMPKKS